MGLAASFARPGGNVTGLTEIAPEIAGKRLEWLTEVVPGIARVAVLRNAAATASEWPHIQAAAQQLRLQLHALEIRSPEDVQGAFGAATGNQAEALLLVTDPLTLTLRTQIPDLAAKSRLPSMYDRREYVELGGLAGYGPNIADLFRRAAVYVDKILKGANPADLPIERPTTFDFVINLKTARALGLTIPQSILMQATEVIQ